LLRKHPSDRFRRQFSGTDLPNLVQGFSKKTAGVTVDYQSKGSGAGVQDFLNKTVDFAASDSAMKDEDIARLPRARSCCR
jgi:ABC-type phosphate transport system substrate-binding protein